MAQVVLGCDSNGVDDANYQSTVASILEKAGHTVEKCAIQSNAFASYSDGSNGKNPKGKIGIYLIAPGTYSIADATYGTSKFKYNYFGIRPECSPSGWTVEDFDTKPIGADPDCPSSLCAKIAGNSFKKINEIVKEKSMVVTGRNATEMGNNLVKAMGGGNASSSDESSGSSSTGNVKECLQKLLTHWDGDVECVFRGKNVFINKIRNPDEFYSCALIEGINLFTDNISLTDINPNTPNHLIVEWTGGTIEFRDEKLIARFGEKLKTMTAVRKVVEYYQDTSSDKDEEGDDGSGSSDDGGSGDTGSDSGSNGSSNTGDGASETTNIGGAEFY